MRKRYRLIDTERLVELTHAGDLASFRRDYVAAVEHVLKTRVLRREPIWTEAIAVGDEAYVLGIAEAVRGRAKLLLAETDTGAWVLREAHDKDGDDGLDGAFLLREDFDGGRIVAKLSGSGCRVR